MSKIVLYHGTTADFRRVSLNYAKSNKDFGRGFYLTTDYNQAYNLAYKMKIRNIQRWGDSKGFIYCFKFDSKLFNNLKIHTFKGANRAWLDYIVSNREGKNDGVKSCRC